MWTDPIRITTLALTIAGIVVWAFWGKKNKRNWRYIIPIELYLIHTAIFYILRYFPISITAEELNLWSSIIRLQALVTILGVGIVLSQERYEP